jgi:hypothetical protein
VEMGRYIERLKTTSLDHVGSKCIDANKSVNWKTSLHDYFGVVVRDLDEISCLFCVLL